MIHEWEALHFLRPQWLLLPFLLLLLERLLRSKDASDDPFKSIIAPSLLQHLRLRKPRRRLFSPDNALLLMFALVTLILAGPSWRQQSSPLAEDTAPLAVLLDVSESMAEQDIEPSRGTRARQKIADLLDRISDKKVALVVFAGSAHTVVPLTNDHDIVRSYVAGIEEGIVPRAGKFPEYAFPSVDRVLAKVQRSGSVLLITDGLGANSEPLIKAWCQQSPHELVIYGVGSEGSDLSNVPLDSSALESLADDCNARFIKNSVDTRDVEAITGALSDGYNIIDNDALPWLDSGYPLIFPALLLALLWFRRGWTRVWGWLLLPLLLTVNEPVHAQNRPDESSLNITDNTVETRIETTWVEQTWDVFVSLWLTPDQYGRLLLQLGFYEKAAHTFEQPMWQATSYYYAEQFESAASLFTRKDSPKARFNEANAHAHRRDYVRALTTYNALLKEYPEFPGAMGNRDWVKKIVDDINRLSQSQQQEDGVGSEDIDDSDPQIGEAGAEELSLEQRPREQFSAEEILASPETAELWLKGVQQDSGRFLRTKFAIQLRERGVSE